MGDALGRLADGVPVEGRSLAVPEERRVPTLAVEGAARLAVLGCVEARAEPPELQPRASLELAEAAAVGVPLLLTRLWSGCQRLEPVAAAVAPAPLPWAL